MSTIYEYNSGLFTTNPAPELFGVRITGSVEFGFDTSNVTGTFFMHDGLVSNGNIAFGVYSMAARTNSSWFELSHGSLVHWFVDTGYFNCGVDGRTCSLSMTFTEQPFTDGTGIHQVCVQICDGAPNGVAPGGWHAVPGPELGAGLPSVMLAVALCAALWRRVRA